MNIVPMNEDYWNWFNHHLPVLAVEDTCGMVAVNDKSIPMAGVVFDNWTNTSVQTHILIVNPMALKHGFFEICGDYVFYERGKLAVYGMVPGDNVKALSLNKKWGFREVYRLKGAFKEGVDYVIMELLREDYAKLFNEAA